MIYKNSRYTKTKVYDNDGVPVFSIRRRFSIGLENATVHLFSEGDRLDGLANTYYHDSQLWWVILEANPKYRSELDINYGDTLVIPSYEEVMKCLTY